jgi:hypothetical protein
MSRPDPPEEEGTHVEEVLFAGQGGALEQSERGRRGRSLNLALQRPFELVENLG